MKWTRCVARSAAARCASSPSSSAASDVIRKILEHCGLWEEPRAPARGPPVEAQAALELRYEADPDYVPAPEEP
jgi:hypothetical protein